MKKSQTITPIHLGTRIVYRLMMTDFLQSAVFIYLL